VIVPYVPLALPPVEQPVRRTKPGEKKDWKMLFDMSEEKQQRQYEWLAKHPESELNEKVKSKSKSKSKSVAKED
jgi:hypothetical protein